ncbi:MAG: FHA domain-containing protein [Comamonadaceae bacterium]|nr:MAG: FHA domain-containing protein [Comamonadaceae bacterium]
MPLELSVSGPGLQTRRLIDEGQSILIGRDADCDLCLPDPERTVSRQHLVVWVEGGQLQLRVLSVVNGVDLPSGEVPPGGVAVLAAGEILMVGDYDITVQGHSAFSDSSASGFLDQVMPGDHGVHAEEDPFGEWGFDGTVVHRLAPQPAATAASGGEAPAQASADASQTLRLAAVGVAMTGDVAAFYKGLGLDPARLSALSAQELEAAGRKIRIVLQGLMELHSAKVELNRDMGADERTMVATRETNPLKTDWPLDTKIEYLLAGRSAGAAFMPPEAAIAALVAELRIHDMSVTAASRAVVEGALREFDPGKIEARIGEDKSAGILAKLRPWDAYAKYYAGESGRMAQWVERLFNRYFTPAYTRETTRIKRGGERRE